MASLLLVDDSDLFRMVARSILEEQGVDLDIVEACDGAEALSVCRTAMPDAILLDWEMPVVNGAGFLEALKDIPSTRRPKIVLCSSAIARINLPEIFDAGVRCYIEKPYEPALFLGALRLAEII